MKNYKIKIDKKKFIRAIILMALIFVIAIFGIPALFKQDNSTTSVANLKVLSVVREGIAVEDDDIETFLTDYFKTYYSALGTLKSKDVTAYYDQEDEGSYQSGLINQGALDYLIAYRAASENDLRFSACTFGITFSDIDENDDGSVTVSLLTDEEVSFAFLTEMSISSYISAMPHTFILKETDDGYQIISHIYDDTAYLAFEEKLNETLIKGKTYTQQEFKTIAEGLKSEMIDTAVSYLNGYQTQKESFNQDPQSYSSSTNTDHFYDRDSAVAYAMKWVGKTEAVRNSDEWTTYDYYGGNCNNFVSQCIYTGGIPMDTSGDYIWKWYGDTPDSTSAKEGRSPSWTGVGRFYDYCQNNEGYGMSADIGKNLYSGNKGDVIIMGSDEDWSHVVLITNVIKDESGNIVDYLINSNTSDRINYPLSAYGHIKLELIRIHGWNDK